MPSNAYINFLYMRVDVLKLIATHRSYTYKKPGRKDLGHLTRSAVIMLCAAWERYNEDLVLESISYIASNINDANLLNNIIKKTISNKVKADLHDFSPIFLSGNGWKEAWFNYAKVETDNLNTPKFGRLNELFRSYLGIEGYSNIWGAPSRPTQINEFIVERGNIAHNGAKAKYVGMKKLRFYQDLITDTVIEIDSIIALKLQAMASTSGPAWERRYSVELSTYKKKK